MPFTAFHILDVGNIKSKTQAHFPLHISNLTLRLVYLFDHRLQLRTKEIFTSVLELKQQNKAIKIRPK